MSHNQEDKYLILKGCAGLGNRLFTILNALSYCELSQRKLFIDWSDGQFGRKNENIFTQFINISHPLYIDDLPKSFSNTNDVFPITWKGNLKKSVYEIYNVGEPNFILKNIPSFFLNKKNKFRKSQLWVRRGMSTKYGFKAMMDQKNMDFGSNLILNNNAKFLIYSDFYPSYNNIKFLKYLKLKGSCLSKIDHWNKKYNLKENYIGIHIRFSDKKPEKSVDFLIEYLQKNHNSRSIFLSTDNIEIEKLFHAKFEDKLLIYPKKIPPLINGRGIHMWGLDNNDDDYNKEMLEASIFDIWLLSKCKILYYQGNSSFSAFSKFLHPKPENCINWLKIFD